MPDQSSLRRVEAPLGWTHALELYAEFTPQPPPGPSSNGTPSLAADSTDLETVRYRLDPPFYDSQHNQVGTGWDNRLSRALIWKAPKQSSVQQTFERELRLVAGLSHPHILPIFDCIWLEGGRPAALMPVVQPSSQDRFEPDTWSTLLRHPLAELSLESDTRQEKHTSAGSLEPRMRLPPWLTQFQKVCLALAHVHERRIVHGDIKPDNILVGSPGQVYLIDFGVALKLDEEPQRTQPWGTFAYAAPEQLQGAPVGLRTDVFGLGGLLYFLLTGGPPFPVLPGERVSSYLRRRELTPRPVRPRGDAQSPVDLLDLALACLDPDPSARPDSVLVIYQEVERWLEGIRFSGFRQKEAQRLAAIAEALLAQRQDLLEQKQEALRVRSALQRRVEQELKLEAEEVPSARRTAPSEKARDGLTHSRPSPLQAAQDALWTQDNRLRQLQEALDRLVLQATRQAELALEQDPSLQGIRDQFFSLWWDRAVQLELKSWGTERIMVTAWLERLDGEELERRRREGGSLELLSTHPTRLELMRLEPHGPLLRPAEATRQVQRMNAGDQRVLHLPPGRWQVSAHFGEEATALGRTPSTRVDYPVLIRWGETLRLVLSPPPEGVLPEGFCWIPAGPVLLGGDEESHRPDIQLEQLEPFVIGRFPVTCSEYLRFLNALFPKTPLKAAEHAPRTAGGNPLFALEPAQGYWLPETDEDGDPNHPNQPITGISAFDAEAYCAWLSSTLRLPFRLPTSSEWEKSARGADLRAFPWGDEWESRFCNSRDSLNQRPQLLPVGHFERNGSPFGVRDLAGGVSEWTAAPEINLAGEGIAGLLGEPPPSQAPPRRRVCGGSWHTHARQCRAAREVTSPPEYRGPSIGFRVACSSPVLTAIVESGFNPGGSAHGAR